MGAAAHNGEQDLRNSHPDRSGRWKQVMKSNRVVTRDDALNLSLQSRIQLEAHLTDDEAAERAKVRPIAGRLAFEEYCNRSPWKKFLFDFLGPMRGKTILDIGCGYNPTPIYFASAGARQVYACDVSPKAVSYQQRIAEEAGVADRVSVVVCSVEQLPLPSQHVDLVHGEATIHHLCLRLAGPEIARVLKSGGRGAFKDPLGHNPLLEFARDYLPYAWKAPAKGTDRPLKYEDIEVFGRGFSRYKYRGLCLFSIIAAFIAGPGPSRLRGATDRMDAWILNKFPFLQRYCRYVVTCVEN